MCCNGVLFADVELQKGDDAARLDALGMFLEKRGRKLRFQQPCSCFDGKLCRIYAERPSRCAAFECGLLLRVREEVVTTAAALQTIRATLRQADRVRELLQRLGQKDEDWPLTHRFNEVMARPLDLSEGEEEADLRGELMSEMDRLMEMLQHDFRT